MPLLSLLLSCIGYQDYTEPEEISHQDLMPRLAQASVEPKDSDPCHENPSVGNCTPPETDLLQELANNGSSDTALLHPKIKPDSCSVDLTQFPQVSISFDEFAGPLFRKPIEKAPLVGETLVPDDDLVFPGEMLEQGSWGLFRDTEIIPVATPLIENAQDMAEDMHGLQPLILDEKAHIRDIDVVLAVDVSGSMRDNQALTDAIVKQVQSHNPKAHVNVQTVNYDTRVLNASSGVSHRGSFNTAGLGTGISGLGNSQEEDHIGALNTGLSLLSKTGPTTGSHKKYIFLVTDEGLKRDQSKTGQVIASAKAQGVSIYLVYQPPVQTSGSAPVPKAGKVTTPSSSLGSTGLGGYGASGLGGLSASGLGGLGTTGRGSLGGLTSGHSATYENFDSLKNIVEQTGGKSIPLVPGRQVPDIFRTNFSELRIGLVTFMDAYPLVAGLRSYHIVNGEGAVCEARVTEAMVEQAYIKGEPGD